VVGFAAHVDAPLLDAARAAGIEASPRSRTFRDLPALLAAPTDLRTGPTAHQGAPPMDTSPPLIPLEHFFENPVRAGAQISPDGTRLGYLAPEGGRLNVWVQPLHGSDDEAVCTTHDHVRGISSWMWSRDSTRILYLQDRGGDEDFHLHVADLARPEAPARDLTPFEGVRVLLVDVPRTDPTSVLVAMNQRDPSAFDVHRLHLGTGAAELVAENPGDVGSWVTDRHGRLLAAVAQTAEGDTEIRVRASEDEPFRSLAVYANEDGGDVHGFTPDGDGLWVGSAKGTDRKRLVRLDLGTAEEAVVDEHPAVDLAAVVLRDRSGELLSAVYLVDRLEWHHHDEAFGASVEAARRLHRGDLQGISRDDAEERWVVTFNDDREPGATFSFDARTGEGTFLFKPRPALDPARSRRWSRSPSRSATAPLHSLLTVPPRGGRSGSDGAAVHGGPWAPGRVGLLPRGPVPRQPRLRRPAGQLPRVDRATGRRSPTPPRASSAEDARRPRRRRRLGGRRRASPTLTRVAIYGGSYGGYARCAASRSPRTSSPPPSPTSALEPRDPHPVLPGVLAALPAGHVVPLRRATPAPRTSPTRGRRRPAGAVAAQLRRPITTPLMVVQGRNDPRVTKVESDQIVAALRGPWRRRRATS
jgi:hypothetical protein